MIEMLALAVAIAFVITCVVIIFLVASVKPVRKAPQKRPVRRLTSYQKRLFNERATKQLAAELLSLLDDDIEAVTSLINQTILTNPGKTLNQCFEKAIREVQYRRH